MLLDLRSQYEAGTTNYTLVIDNVAYVFTGISSTYDVKMPFAVGSYALTGIDIALKKGYLISVGTQTYILTDNAVGLLVARTLPITTATYSETLVNPNFGISMPFAAASFSETLVNPNFGIIIPLSTGVYVVSAPDEQLVYSGAGPVVAVDGYIPIFRPRRGR